MTDKNQIMKQKYPIEAGNFTLARSLRADQEGIKAAGS